MKNGNGLKTRAIAIPGRLDLKFSSPYLRDVYSRDPRVQQWGDELATVWKRQKSWLRNWRNSGG